MRLVVLSNMATSLKNGLVSYDGAHNIGMANVEHR